MTKKGAGRSIPGSHRQHPPPAPSVPRCSLQTGKGGQTLQGPLFQGSREQDKHLRPLQTGKMTDPQAESSGNQRWGKTNTAICAEAFGGVIWLNVLQGQGAAASSARRSHFHTVKCTTARRLEGPVDRGDAKEHCKGQSRTSSNAGLTP